MNFPNNPTGQIPSKEQILSLTQYFKENNWIVLSDEIYTGLTYDDSNYFSLSQYLPEQTIVLGGISKWAGSGGWRVGFAALPKICEPWMKTIKSIISETISCVASPIQFASVPAFEDSQEMRDYKLISQKSLQKIGLFTAKRFREMGAQCLNPKGAFYVFPDFSEIINTSKREKNGIKGSLQFEDKLFEVKGISVLAGDHFERDPEELTVRVAYTEFEGYLIMEELMAIISPVDDIQKKKKLIDAFMQEDFMNKYCPNIVEELHQFEQFIKEL